MTAGGWREPEAVIQFKHANKPGTVTVAGQAGIDVPIGTLNAILKQAGLKK